MESGVFGEDLSLEVLQEIFAVRTKVGSKVHVDRGWPAGRRVVSESGMYTSRIDGREKEKVILAWQSEIAEIHKQMAH